MALPWKTQTVSKCPSWKLLFVHATVKPFQYDLHSIKSFGYFWHSLNPFGYIASSHLDIFHIASIHWIHSIKPFGYFLHNIKTFGYILHSTEPFAIFYIGSSHFGYSSWNDYNALINISLMKRLWGHYTYRESNMLCLIADYFCVQLLRQLCLLQDLLESRSLPGLVKLYVQSWNKHW